jgi:hypothetical protein
VRRSSRYSSLSTPSSSRSGAYHLRAAAAAAACKRLTGFTSSLDRVAQQRVAEMLGTDIRTHIGRERWTHAIHWFCFLPVR